VDASDIECHDDAHNNSAGVTDNRIGMAGCIERPPWPWPRYTQWDNYETSIMRFSILQHTLGLLESDIEV
jgi:hypothetical protein